MPNTATRRKPPPHLERRYEAWRLEEQVITAAYALLVPVPRRSLPLAPPSGRGRVGDRANGTRAQAQGG